ncbi:hypothetical protein GJU40_13025 [Bacillus lacus]|uniref:Uncharacterized protein n=1 Tax=Metabacillus lacus TaxID=1983721 RepID=A0A7X2J0L6_9BACI|nr:hypothetical protein [Metabacillus lacus]MRX73064.1 hypothetical protein [Metabacillus lacus]
MGSHKKALGALVLYIVTVVFIWSYFSQLKHYHQLHAISQGESFGHMAVFLIIGVTVYTLLIYCALVLYWTNIGRKNIRVR